MHMAHGVHCTPAADLSHMTDRQTDRLTDTANIGNNSLNLMHSMQPKNQLQETYLHLHIPSLEKGFAQSP